jgi:hypothetical protein
MQLKEIQKKIHLKEKKLTYEKSAFEQVNFHAKSTAQEQNRNEVLAKKIAEIESKVMKEGVEEEREMSFIFDQKGGLQKIFRKKDETPQKTIEVPKDEQERVRLELKPYLQGREGKLGNGISNRARDFIKILQTEDTEEKKRIEREIQAECKLLLKELESARTKRGELLGQNSDLYIRISQNKADLAVSALL